MIGKTISHYKILEKLGEGGMGVVYKAEDTKLKRLVALKFLPFRRAHVEPSFLRASEAEKTRFIHEAQAAAALNHPNICTIYEIDEADGQTFIAMEFVEGASLKEKIAAGPLKIDEAINLAAQIAEGLQAAHEKGITHRDIKPANVMITNKGQAKIMDFGLAKLADQKTRLTKTGMTVGTVAYMSPEQAQGADADHRSDIWSFGVMLYEMITGQHPFKGLYEQAVMYSIMNEEPEPMTGLRTGVPMELERIVNKAMRKDRSGRYQSVNELAVDLKSLPQNLEKAKTAVRLSGVKPFRKARVHVYAGITVLLISLVFVLFNLFTDQGGPIDSIAVLPFVNTSGDPDVEYLSDGVTESLINSLSQLPNLSVKARSTVFRYKGKDVEPKKVGDELSVQAVLNGRVVERGENLTLSLELVNVRTGNQIWGEQYIRKLADLASLPGEISRDVSNKLRVKLSSADERKLAKTYTANAEAYELYLKGRYHLFKLTPPEIQKGIAYLQQAIEIDPAYALAYVGLSEAYRSLALAGEMTPTEFFPKSKAAAQKAIEIDDALAEAHTALGVNFFWYDWNWNEAEKQYQRALELNPNSVDAHMFYAHLLSNTGRHAEGLAEIKRARELDPLSPFVGALEGQFLIHAGRTDEALARLQKTFELAPDFWFPHLHAASAYIEKGMLAEAIAEARKSKELSGGETHSMAFLGYALAKLGKQAEARAQLEELLKRSIVRHVPPYNIALIYNGLKEHDEALAWLKRGYEQRDPKMAFLKIEPKWNNLRSDPRFQDLMRRMNFPEY